MATKVSSDISTNVDITARKNDSFYLQATITNSDSTPFDLTGFYTIIFSIKNSNNVEVKRFYRTGSASADTTEVLKAASISYGTPTEGVITINVPSTTTVDSGDNAGTYNNMNILVGSYPYTLKITSTTETHTVLHGKFKVVD